MTAIGIDLGTTYSCVGVYHHLDNRIDIIKSNSGKEKTPSYVSFTDDGIFVGEDAENRAVFYPTNTVFDILTLIGVKYTDQKVQDGIKYWPFKVIPDESSHPIIEVQYQGETKHFSPEEIIAIILRYMKELAENYLKEKVSDVVITVPATFGIIERQSIIHSCLKAELNVIRFIPKSVAAAIAFYDLNKSNIDRSILVYDFGGGSIESSIVSNHGNMFCVKSMSGESNLGGENINNNMLDYSINCFHEKYKNKDTLLPRPLMSLRKSCEESKKVLTTVEKTSICCQSFYNQQDFIESISRSKFEEINQNLFESAMNPIRQVLNDSNISKNKITNIVLMGGSSRIKIIQDKIAKLLPGIQIISVNPDTSSAYGAALYAAAIKNKNFVLNDALAYSLGYAKDNSNRISLLQKNMAFPIKKL